MFPFFYSFILEAFTRGNKHIQSPQFLRDLGFDVIATGEDFFSHNYGDIVVSNPPFNNTFHKKTSSKFNLKAAVIERLIKLNKPFMLLMPTFFFQTKTFGKIHTKYKKEFQFIVPTGKIWFYHLNKDGTRLPKGEVPLFYTMWFCWRMNLGEKIIFL